MRARWRTRKKWLRRAGWTIEHESREADAYRLILRSPGGQPVEVVGPNRPRAYRLAARRVLAPR